MKCPRCSRWMGEPVYYPIQQEVTPEFVPYDPPSIRPFPMLEVRVCKCGYTYTKVNNLHTQ